MRILLQFAIIVGICLVGEFLHKIVGIPVPGNILGMVLLFILLCLKVVKIDHIKDVSDFLLKYIAFFFLPPSISIMAAGDEVLSQWPLLLAMCVTLTIVTMVSTGWAVQLSVQISKTIKLHRKGIDVKRRAKVGSRESR